MKNCFLIITVLSLAACQSLGDMCPVIQSIYADTRLRSNDPNGPDFREVSGLAFSPSQRYNGEPIFFAISDGGGDARIGMFDSETGKRLRTLRVDKSFFRNADWESVTIGSCGKSGVDRACLYIMDGGDNRARETNGNQGRGDYRILKIREPKLDDYDDNDLISKSRMSRLDYDYRHSSSPTNYADCEAMFLDHKGWGDDEDIGDIYFATKWDMGNDTKNNRLFRIPANAWSSSLNGSTRDYSPRTVGSYNLGDYQKGGGTHIMKTTWTSGEMSFDGTLISLGNLQKNYVWLRCPGTSVVDALVNPNLDSRACLDWSHPATGQVETFAWTPDMRYGLAIPEGNSPKMGWTKFTYDRNRSSRVCEAPPTSPPTPLQISEPLLTRVGHNGSPLGAFPLQLCQGDCDSDSDCQGNLKCMQRDGKEEVPGCRGNGRSGIDYCYNPSELKVVGNKQDSPPESPSSSPSSSSKPGSATSVMPCNGHLFKFVMQTDYIGNEISWKLNNSDQQVAGGSDYPNNSLIEVTRCVDGGIHTFSILDTFGDGICCQYGPGWYQIWYDGVIIHDSDGKYGSEEIISFTESGIVESPNPSTAPSDKREAL